MSEGVLDTSVFRLHLVMFRVIIATSDGIFQIPKWSWVICFLFNIHKNCNENMFSKNYRQRLIAFIFINTMQYPRTLRNNNHSNKRETPPFFHSETNIWPCSGPICWQIPCSGCNRGTDWVAILEYIFFQNKSLRLTRFRRSYVVLTNHCQNYAAFLLHVYCLKWSRSCFGSCFSPMIVHLRNRFL